MAPFLLWQWQDPTQASSNRWSVPVRVPRLISTQLWFFTFFYFENTRWRKVNIGLLYFHFQDVQLNKSLSLLISNQNRFFEILTFLSRLEDQPYLWWTYKNCKALFGNKCRNVLSKMVENCTDC